MGTGVVGMYVNDQAMDEEFESWSRSSAGSSAA